MIKPGLEIGTIFPREISPFKPTLVYKVARDFKEDGSVYWEKYVKKTKCSFRETTVPYFRCCGLVTIDLEEIAESTSADTRYKEAIDKIFEWRPL